MSSKWRVISEVLFVFVAFTVLSAAQTTLVIPQIADGGGWQTALVLTNTTTNPATVNLSFFQDTGAGATQNWTLSFLETSSPQDLSLPAAGTLFLHTAGTAATTSTGWAQMQASNGVVAYAIFTLRVSGRQDQDGTSEAAASATRVLVPVDNTNGFATSIGISNPTSSSESISVGWQPTSGSSAQLSSLTLPAQGHSAFATAQQFSATAGMSGLLEFYSASGNISVLALRFNPTGAFTTAPAYAQTGPPIIGSSTGGGSLPQFTTLIVTSTAASDAQLGFKVGIQLLASNGQPIACQANLPPVFGSSNSLGADVNWSGYSSSGLTVTCTGLNVTTSDMENFSTSARAQVTSASLTFTLTPQTVSTSGTVSGTVNLVSTEGTMSGSFSGTYTAQ